MNDNITVKQFREICRFFVLIHKMLQQQINIIFNIIILLFNFYIPLQHGDNLHPAFS